MLEEEEALELAKKPLDEILKMGMPEELPEEEAGNDETAEDQEGGPIKVDGDLAPADVVDNEAASDEQSDEENQGAQILEFVNQDADREADS